MFDHLDVEAYDREYSDRQLAGRVLAYFRPHRRRTVVVTAAVLTVALLTAGVPLLISNGLRLLEGANDAALAATAIAILAAWVLIWSVNYVRRRELAQLIGDIVLTMRRDAFTAAVRHDLSFYDTFASGRVVSRITSDTSDFGQTVILVTDLVSQVLVMVLLAAVLYWLSPGLATLLFLWAPIVIAMALGFRKVARRVTRQGSRAMADVNGKIFETIAGIAVAKNFRREATVFDEFAEVNSRSYRINLKRGFVLATVFPVLNILAGVGTALLVYFGGLSVLEGAIIIGAWNLFLQSLEQFWFPLINLAAFWSQVQAGFSAVERVFALIDYASSVTQRASEPVPTLEGDIRFDKVCLRYGDGSVVLPELELHVRPGETVALVGHTGAGKSSVARLVARFYEYQDGALLIDGHDIRTLDLLEYRRHLGIVPQAPFLFNGTVAENIRYARPDVTDSQILTLARQIGDGEWLEALPAGLETEVGERGAQLSMGQRQLVALMRVLVQQPAIFILDEATASVDPFTESQIQDALDLILSHATSLVIAHRLSTVRAADRIIVLSKGRIIEQGSHDALMAAGGEYAVLYDTYFRHQSPDYLAAGAAGGTPNGHSPTAAMTPHPAQTKERHP
jgi:ATP-binding cassette subfamily B protein